MPGLWQSLGAGHAHAITDCRVAVSCDVFATSSPSLGDARTATDNNGMNEKPKDLYRVFAPGVPNVRVISERLSEAEARSRKREILMAYPAANVRIEKVDESGQE